MKPDALVHADNLVVCRGRFALRVPQWNVAAGEVVGIVGPNGAGKTTLLETIAGFRHADAGRISVFGFDPWRDPVDVRLSLGFMADDLPIFGMRIADLLRTLSGYYATWDQDLAQEMLRRFDLDPKKNTMQLSRGEGTRVRLLAAMAFRPRLLVLDEPASGLDLSGRRELLESVLTIVRDPSRSVIFSSHLLHDVERISDRLLVLDGGNVIRDGPTDSLVGEGRTLEEALESWGAL